MLLISGYFGSLSLIVSAHAAFAKNGFSKLKWGMNEHLAAAATRCHQNRKQLPKTRHGPCCQFLPLFRCPSTPHLWPTRCRLAPGLSCPPCARKLFTEGNNSDKGIKIASNDGKHFAERSVDKRGNRAVKKIGGEGQRERWASVTILESRSSWYRAQRPRQPHGQQGPNGPPSLSDSGPNPVLCYPASRH